SEIGGDWVEGDVAHRASGERAISEGGGLDLLVANAGISEGHEPQPTWEIDPQAWGRGYEGNGLGGRLCCRAGIPGMVERRRGRRGVGWGLGGGGAGTVRGGTRTGYRQSRAGTCRYGEMLANELAGRIPVFFFSPGLVQTDMTAGFGDDAPWTPPELAPELVRR